MTVQSPYRNYKRELRRKVKDGVITEAERWELQSLAKACQKAGEQVGHRPPRDDYATGKAWLEEGNDPPDPIAVDHGDCNEERIGARGRACCCDCLGVNHGAATGMDPEDVCVAGWTKPQRRAAGLL